MIQCQAAPGQPPPSGLSFADPDGARVDLGPWQPVDFNRWQLRVPLRPLVRTYVPAHTTTPPEGR